MGPVEDHAVWSREAVAALASDKITVEEWDGKLQAVIRMEAPPWAEEIMARASEAPVFGHSVSMVPHD